MDLKNYKIKLTVRSIVLYEKLVNEKIASCDTEEKMKYMMYATLIANNPELKLSFNVFNNMLANKKIFEWLEQEYDNITQFNSQFMTNDEGGEEKEELWMSEIASSLIILYGLDPEYVYDKMQLYEIADYLKVADIKKKEEYEDKRLWAYIGLSPYLPKKMKSPTDLFMYPWEKDDLKKNAEDDLKKNEELIMDMLK